jgi:uncharacterized PurR-regulated membrane protein YhhQ (DUF165 family)
MIRSTYPLIGLYLAAIVIANLSVALFGPGVAVVNAFVLIGLDLTARDRLHETWRGRQLAAKMAALIAAGSLISWLLNRGAGPIALASFVAFAAAATVDSLAYAALGKRSDLLKVNGSNVLSAAVDSLIFPALAFGLPLLWPIVIGQFLAKVIGGALWSLVLRRGRQLGMGV